jgi:hypothetical protein
MGNPIHVPMGDWADIKEAGLQDPSIRQHLPQQMDAIRRLQMDDISCISLFVKVRSRAWHEVICMRWAAHLVPWAQAIYMRLCSVDKCSHTYTYW